MLWLIIVHQMNPNSRHYRCHLCCTIIGNRLSCSSMETMIADRDLSGPITNCWLKIDRQGMFILLIPHSSPTGGKGHRPTNKCQLTTFKESSIDSQPVLSSIPWTLTSSCRDSKGLYDFEIWHLPQPGIYIRTFECYCPQMWPRYREHRLRVVRWQRVLHTEGSRPYKLLEYRTFEKKNVQVPGCRWLHVSTLRTILTHFKPSS